MVFHKLEMCFDLEGEIHRNNLLETNVMKYLKLALSHFLHFGHSFMLIYSKIRDFFFYKKQVRLLRQFALKSLDF